MDLSTLAIMGIIFIASLVRSTFGFGESLVAVPLLLFFVPVEIAVPLSVLFSILIAAVVVVQDRKQVHFSSAKWLLVFAALGIPAGLLLLVHANENILRSGLGILIILYSGYSLLSPGNLRISKDHKGWLFTCGFLSGIFGGAYGLNGPPLVIYGNMRSWSPKHFRATLQAYFLPASLLGMLGYWYNGLWTWTLTYYFLISLPAAVPAIFLGRFFNQRLRKSTFIRYVYIGLLGIGTTLLTQALV